MGKEAAFAGVDGGGGAPEGFGGACFYFDEDEAIGVAEDKVNFAAVGLKICGEKFEAEFAEMFFGGAFADFAVTRTQGFFSFTAPKLDAREDAHALIEQRRAIESVGIE